MARIWTTQLGQYVGEHVVLAGWLHNLRRLSGVTFSGAGTDLVQPACLLADHGASRTRLRSRSS